MPRCLKCSQVVDGADALCSSCEQLDASAAAPALPVLEADMPGGVVPPAAGAPAAQNTSPKPAGWSRWHMAVAAAGGAAALTFAVLGTNGVGDLATADQASIVGVARGSGVPAAPHAVHTWTGANSARWVSNYRRSIAFEVAAENTLLAGMARVRPILVVRCLANTTEAFVFTQWPAAIEPQDDKRTTRISFDGEAESTERWLSSADRDALFAPDGVAFAQRLARGQTMRFGFTPHNGPPTTIEFHIDGFAAHVGDVARLCKWK